MKKKVSAIATIVLGTVFVPLSTRSQPALAQPSLNASERGVRVGMGLSDAPTEALTEQVGPLRLTKKEAALYAAHEKALQAANTDLVEIARKPGVIGTWIDDWKTNKLVVWIDKSGRGERADLKQIQLAGFKTFVQLKTFTKDEFLTARDALAEAGGTSTHVDIDGRPRQEYVRVPEIEQGIRDMITAIDTEKIDILGTIQEAKDPAIVLRVDPSSIGRVQQIVPKVLSGIVRVQPGSKIKKAQQAGPWFGGDGRTHASTIIRGGKQINGGICTSGPVVRSTGGVDYATTAGHCFTSAAATTLIPTNINMAGAGARVIHACVTDWTNCSPNTYRRPNHR